MTCEIDNNECKTKRKVSCFLDSPFNRILAGTMLIILSFTYAAAVDMPGSLEIIIEKIFSLYPYQFEYMYSIYGLPTSISCLFNGLLVDKVTGLHLGTIIFGLIALIGQSIITLGGFIQIYWIMLMGRFFFSIGAESVIVSVNCYVDVWFKDKENHFVFGLIVAATRLGSSAAFLISYAMHQLCIQEAFEKSFAFGFTLFPFLGIICCQVIVAVLLGWYSLTNHKKVGKLTDIDRSVQLKHILSFPKGFWLFVAMFSICAPTFYVFISIAQDFMQRKYNVTMDVAVHLSSLFIILSSIVPIITGLLGDKLGRNLYFASLGIIIGLISLIIFITVEGNPYFPLVLYSTSFGILCSYSWPAIPLAVEPYQLATAYAVLECLINVNYTIFPLTVGYLLGTYGPNGVSLFFIGCLLLGLLCLVLLYIFDNRAYRILNMSGKHRREFIELQ